MVNQKDILARLQAGESADAIAQELVDVLNAANAEFAKAQEAANQRQEKLDYIEEIGELIRDYVLTFYADSAIADAIKDQELDAAEILDAVDAAFDQLDAEVRKLKQIESMFGGLLSHLEDKNESKSDALRDFLKANGLA